MQFHVIFKAKSDLYSILEKQATQSDNDKWTQERHQIQQKQTSSKTF